MDLTFEALYLLSKHASQYKLRIPLGTLIDYKGFRCLAIALIPISTNKGPIIGYHNYKYVQTDPELKSAFMNLGEVLNLKENDNR